jgi:hypothetical protein
MKSKIFTLFTLLICCNFSQSQIVKSIGIKSGISLSNQSWEETHLSNDYIFNASPGLYEAITFDFFDKEYWQLSADLGIYQSASKSEKSPFPSYTFESNPSFDFKFGFITFNPAFKLKIPLKSFTAYALIAPRVDYYYSKLSNYQIEALNFEVNKLVYGFNFGEGVSYNLKNISIFAEYQFFYSFNNLMDKSFFYENSYGDSSNDRVKANTHVISLGIKYHFTKAEKPSDNQEIK